MYASDGHRLPIVQHIKNKPMVVAAINMVLLCVIGVELQHLGIVHQFYASPLVALVAFNTCRYGRSAGLISTTMATIAFNLLFQPPRWAFQPVTSAEMVVYISMVAMVFALSSSQVRRAYVQRSPAPQFGVRTVSGAVIVCDGSGTPIQEIRDI